MAPGLNPAVVKAAQGCGLPFAPGIATPSELERAIELGCLLVKFFPAEAQGGIKYLKSISAPYKHLGIVRPACAILPGLRCTDVLFLSPGLFPSRRRQCFEHEGVSRYRRCSGRGRVLDRSEPTSFYLSAPCLSLFISHQIFNRKRKKLQRRISPRLQWLPKRSAGLFRVLLTES